MNAGPLDVQAIRRHFSFPRLGRIATNNAASTQPPRELLERDSTARDETASITIIERL